MKYLGDSVKKNLYTKLFVYFSIILICIISIIIFNKTNVSKKVTAKYNLNSNIDYSIKNKDGNISNSKLFVSELVDSININFYSKYLLNKNSNIKYRYEIISYVISNIDDNTLEETEVYKKEEVIKKTNIMSLNSNVIDLSDSININYDYYNNIATEYDNSVNLAIKSRLLINYNLYITINDGEEKLYTSSLSLPLEKSTFSITKNENNSSDTIYGDDNTLSVINVITLCLTFVLVLLIILEIIKISKYKKEHAIEFKYRKIMQEYSNVVVPINKIPKDEKIVSVNVLYFKSMIDIQKELHLPILCYKNNEFIVYMIINDKLAYVYFLNENEEKI